MSGDEVRKVVESALQSTIVTFEMGERAYLEYVFSSQRINAQPVIRCNLNLSEYGIEAVYGNGQRKNLSDGIS